MATTKPKSNLDSLEALLWDSADELRANSGLKESEYSVPVLGLLFLKYADNRFGAAQAELAGQGSSRRAVGKTDYQARGVLYLPPAARYNTLLELPEGTNVGQAINDAMKAIEEANEDLRGVLPRTYNALSNSTLVTLLRNVNAALANLDGDGIGKVYEYFLGKFALAEGRMAGRFFTPTSIVRLIVEIVEPFSGKVLDPACGSGGMFVQSNRFVQAHRKNELDRLSIYGQEQVEETVKLCKMNLAVHGLAGQVKQANTYYEDPFDCVAQFDFVMANPPFNVNKIDKAKLVDDHRFPLGVPRVDNGNYLWIEIFYSALNERGRAGFVMANSAGDAGGSEMEIRRRLIEAQVVDVVVSIGPNFFFTVTLPCTLWFLDKGKRAGERAGKVLFIDARKVFHQIDRAHRDFLPEQIEFLANITRLYREEAIETVAGSGELMAASFGDGTYADVPGLCAVATMDQIETQGWSLNPGRYVGVTASGGDGIDFAVRLEELNEELEGLNLEAAGLQGRIAANVAELLV